MAPDSSASGARLRLPSGESVPLDRRVTIGRAPDNDVVLDHPTVSRYHCVIAPEGDSLVISDQNSSYGTYLNGTTRIEDGCSLKDKDRIKLGDLELRVEWQSSDPDGRLDAAGPDEDAEVIPMITFPGLRRPKSKSVRLYLRQGPDAPRLLEWDGSAPFTIGRSDTSSLPVASEDVSRHHAEIRDRNGAPVISDLGSANGSKVNGAPIADPHELRPNDRIMVGPVELVFDPEEDEHFASLVEKHNALAGQGIRLRPAITTVGGLPDCHVQLPQPAQPVEYARIVRFYSDYWLFPTGNDLPVAVNRSPIVVATRLEHGDTVQIGDAEFEFRQQVEEGEPVETPANRVLTLREVAPFSGLDDVAFEALSGAGKLVSFGPNVTIMRPEKGKRPRNGSVVVILSGEAEVRGAIAGDRNNVAVLARLKPGDYCGERALAYGHVYPHQVVTTSHVEAFTVGQREYQRLTARIPSLAGFFKDKVTRHGLVKYLRDVPLLSQADEELLDRLADRMKLRSFPDGDVLARKGEICRTFYLIASGSCRVNGIQANALVTLTHLTEGKFIGEQIAAQEEVYPYTVIAESAVEAYVLTRDEFLALSQEAPVATDFGAAGVPASVILQRTAPFSDLAPELVAMVARALRIKRFAPGETIIYQDDPEANAFYIIAEGKVEVLFRNREGEERVLVQLKPGESFGEAALLTGAPRNATVRAIEECELLTLYRREFDEIVRRSPQQAGQYFVLTHNSRNRPKRIENVEIFEERVRDRVGYILKNRERNTYVKLSEQGLFVWELMDGDHTLTDIAAAYFQRYQTFAMGPMIQTVAQLQRLGFIDTNLDNLMKLLNQQARLSPLQRLMVYAFKVLTAKFEFKNAHALFSALYYGFCRIFFFRAVLALIALINIAGIAVFFYLLFGGSGTTSFSFSAASIPLLIVLSVIITVTHEMGHGVTMIHIGRKVLGAGLGWNYIAPMAFVNTTDAWLATKGQRLAVTAGGLVVTTTEAALCTLGLLVVQDESLRAALAIGASLSYLTFFFNANPMVPTDGYNFLVDLLSIQDLRPRALHYLFSGGVFRDLWRRTLGGEQRAYAVFGIFVALFMVYGGLSIALVLSQFATQPLQSVLPAPVVVAVQFTLLALLFIFFILGLLREARIGAQKAH